MKARWKVFFGALVVVPVVMALWAPPGKAAPAAVSGLLFVFMCGILAFGLWVDTVLYFGDAADEDEASAASDEEYAGATDDADALDGDAGAASCQDCGRPVPAERERCEHCSTVGTWRK